MEGPSFWKSARWGQYQGTAQFLHKRGGEYYEVVRRNEVNFHVLIWEKKMVRIEILIEQEERNLKTILLKKKRKQPENCGYVYVFLKVEKDIQQISNTDDSREVRLDGVKGKKEGSFYFALLCFITGF